jgi:PKD repeat protein
LEASPTEGSSPLTVKFTAHADDPATGGKIKEYRFDYGDASGGQPQVWFQTDPVSYHRYELSGNYEAKLKIQDNAGNWRESDDCKATIKVNSVPQVLGSSTPSELPSTGLSLLILSLLPLGGIGYLLYRHFKLA